MDEGGLYNNTINLFKKYKTHNSNDFKGFKFSYPYGTMYISDVKIDGSCLCLNIHKVNKDHDTIFNGETIVSEVPLVEALNSALLAAIEEIGGNKN